MTDERLTIWVGLLKFVLGTFIIGIASMLINREFQKREVELKEMEQLGKFVEHALTEDVGVRLRFAQYFSNVTRSEELKAGWTQYTAVVQQEYDDKQTRVASLEKKLADENPEPVTRVALQTEIQQLKTQLEVPKINRRDMVSQLNRENRFDEVLDLDPHNTYALSRKLQQLTEEQKFAEATDLLPRLRSANTSGVGYTAYPFAIYAYLKQGEREVAQKLYQELEKAIREDIANGYGYLSRTEQIRWVQDSFRDVAFSAQDAREKRILEGYIEAMEKLVRRAGTVRAG